MLVNHAHITNWEPPNREWWKHVEQHPNEPLIEATMDLTLSWEEYHNLIKRDHEQRKKDALQIQETTGVHVREASEDRQEMVSEIRQQNP